MPLGKITKVLFILGILVDLAEAITVVFSGDDDDPLRKAQRMVDRLHTLD